jgi:ABC-type Fe3+/spermidine/putrescine transport system ATPase subunit
VTHDQEEAVVLADRIALLLEGRLRQTGAPADFYNRPVDADVARFFGGVNFIAGQSAGGRFHSALGALRLPPDAATGAGTLTIRPEAVRLKDAPENALTATLISRLFLGTQTRLLLSSGDTLIEALVSPAEAAGLSEGQSLRLTLPAAALWVLPVTAA